MRAALGDKNIDFVAVNDLTSTADAGAPAQVRLDPRQPRTRTCEATGDAHHGRRRRASRCCRSRIRPSCRGRTSASTWCSSRPASSPTATTPAKHLAAGAKKVIITAPGQEARHHDRPGRQRRDLRPGQASHHLERVVHDELPRAVRQGAARELRHRAGLDDDDPLVHERSEPARPAAQGSAPRARGRAVDDPDHHRRGEGGRQVLPELKGKLDGIAMRVPTPNVSLVDLAAAGREDHDDGRGERRVQGSRGRTAEGHPRGLRRAARLDRLPAATRNSSIVDAPYTKVMDGDFVKVLSWYDNEWGYSSRCVDLLRYMVGKGL